MSFLMTFLIKAFLVGSIILLLAAITVWIVSSMAYFVGELIDEKNLKNKRREMR